MPRAARQEQLNLIYDKLAQTDSWSHSDDEYDPEDDNIGDEDADDDADDQEVDDEGEQEDAAPLGKWAVEVSWNIAQHLPADLQEYFLWAVGEFILEPVKFRDEWFERLQLAQAEQDAVMLDHPVLRDASASASAPAVAAAADADAVDATQRISAAAGAARAPGAGLSLNEAEDEFVKRLVRSTLAPKLMRLVPKIALQQSSGSLPFPVLPGSHLLPRNPALEFTKTVCATLALDPTAADEVDRLKRSLLRLIGVREFAPEAAFANPSLQLVVRDLICSYCNYCTDVDLCRSPHLLHAAATAAERARERAREREREREPDEARAAWKCLMCGGGYDIAHVESTLVQRVHNLSVAFQLQDMSCTKCGAIRADSMSESCLCSGPWALSTSVAEHRHQLQPFLNVADYYGFRLLREVVRTTEDSYLRC